MKLDSSDKKILNVITFDARMSIADISKKTGIRRDSVKYRIDKLRKNGVIRFFHTTLHPHALGYPVSVYMNFSLQRFTTAIEKAMIGYLMLAPHVVYVAKTVGKWDLTITVVAKDLSHLDQIVCDIKNRFSDNIKDYETSSIIKEFKYDSYTGLF